MCRVVKNICVTFFVPVFVPVLKSYQRFYKFIKWWQDHLKYWDMFVSQCVWFLIPYHLHITSKVLCSTCCPLKVQGLYGPVIYLKHTLTYQCVSSPSPEQSQCDKFWWFPQSSLNRLFQSILHSAHENCTDRIHWTNTDKIIPWRNLLASGGVNISQAEKDFFLCKLQLDWCFSK